MEQEDKYLQSLTQFVTSQAETKTASVIRGKVVSISNTGFTMLSVDLAGGRKDQGGQLVGLVTDVPVLASGATIKVGQYVYLLRQGSLLVALGPAAGVASQTTSKATAPAARSGPIQSVVARSVGSEDPAVTASATITALSDRIADLHNEINVKTAYSRHHRVFAAQLVVIPQTFGLAYVAWDADLWASAPIAISLTRGNQPPANVADLWTPDGMNPDLPAPDTKGFWIGTSLNHAQRIHVIAVGDFTQAAEDRLDKGLAPTATTGATVLNDLNAAMAAGALSSAQLADLKSNPPPSAP